MSQVRQFKKQQQSEIKVRAENMRKELGGTIFAFPVEEENPFPKYAVVMFVGGEYKVFPETANIEEAATGILIILEQMQKEGHDVNYTKDVRFVNYQAQIDAPSVTMRRLKKENVSKPINASLVMYKDD